MEREVSSPFECEKKRMGGKTQENAKGLASDMTMMRSCHNWHLSTCGVSRDGLQSYQGSVNLPGLVSCGALKDMDDKRANDPLEPFRIALQCHWDG